MGVAPVIMRECKIDLWQLRSHRTRSPLRDHAVPDNLVGCRCAADHEQRFVDPKMRVALRSPSAIGPV